MTVTSKLGSCDPRRKTKIEAALRSTIERQRRNDEPIEVLHRQLLWFYTQLFLEDGWRPPAGSAFTTQRRY